VIGSVTTQWPGQKWPESGRRPEGDSPGFMKKQVWRAACRGWRERPDHGLPGQARQGKLVKGARGRVLPRGEEGQPREGAALPRLRREPGADQPSCGVALGGGAEGGTRAMSEDAAAFGRLSQAFTSLPNSL
jgi:hypothetical protein